MKRLTAVLMLSLATLLPAVAQDPAVTARDVVDRETLQAFVYAAKAYADQGHDPCRVPRGLTGIQDRRNVEAGIYLSIRRQPSMAP